MLLRRLPRPPVPARRGPRWIAFGLLATAIAFAADANADEIITGPVDKATFQAIVDAADAGDTIVCLPGDYDFSAAGPVLLSKKITIVAADPADPPRFLGTDDGSGGYARTGPPLSGNTAFAVRGGTTLHGLTLEGLRLERFERTIVLYDGFDDQRANCAAVPAGLTKVKIVDNAFENVRRGVQTLGGPLKDLEISGNQIDADQIGIYLSGVTGCADPFGGGRFVDDTALIHGPEITGNDVNAFIGVIALHTKNARIDGNTIAGLGTALNIVGFGNGTESGAVHFGSAEGNILSAPFDAAIVVQLLGDPSLTMRGDIRNNAVQNSPFGIYFAPGVNGLKVSDTDFSGIGAVHVYLDTDTHDNMITVRSGEIVEDHGTDNKIKTRK